MPSLLAGLALAAVISGGATRIIAQQTAAQGQEALNVFLDCQAPYCDSDHFRREITYVNWMRERQDAQVHILITAQQTGGGGWEFTFAFIGRGTFTGREDTLRYVSRNTDSPSEIRDGLTQTIKLGLVRYAARTPIGARLRITYQAGQGGPIQQARPEDDPWKFWTFRVGVGGDVSGEQRQRFLSYNANVNASRVTEDYKLTLALSGNENRSEFDIADLDTTIVSVRSNWSGRVLSVWSLGPQWSFGVRGSVGGSTFLNRDLFVRAGPAIEYNFFPYNESTRRLIVVQYGVGIAGFDYEEETIFDRFTETRPEHQLVVGSEIQQPWGSVDVALTGNQYLHDLSKHSASLSGGVTLRLVRGLDLRVFGSVARIKDQLHLSKAGLTRDEILLRQRQLGTDFQYFSFFNLQYRFGSKFANVVNPRMRLGGGGQQFVVFF